MGRALEEIHARRTEEHAAELAEHFAQSTEQEDLEKALAYGEMAAERSMAVYAYGEAARLLEQALQVQEVLDPEDSTRRCDLLLSLAEALMPAGEPQRVYETVAHEAFALAEVTADRTRASRACGVALDAAGRHGAGALSGTPEYRQWVERADQYAEPGTPGRVFADIALWFVQFFAGDLADARALSVRALELARRLDDPEALYLAALAFIVGAPVQSEEERWALVTELAAHPHVGVSGTILGTWLQFSAMVCMDRGDRARAEGLWEELSQLAERTHDANAIVRSFASQFWSEIVDGRLEGAVSAADRVLDRGEGVGVPVMGQVLSVYMSFRPLLYLGRGDEAMAAIEETARLAGAGDTSLLESMSVMLRAHVGSRDEAEDGLRQLITKHQVAFENESLPMHLLVTLWKPRC